MDGMDCVYSGDAELWNRYSGWLGLLSCFSKLLLGRNKCVLCVRMRVKWKSWVWPRLRCVHHHLLSFILGTQLDYISQLPLNLDVAKWQRSDQWGCRKSWCMWLPGMAHTIPPGGHLFSFWNARMGTSPRKNLGFTCWRWQSHKMERVWVSEPHLKKMYPIRNNFTRLW